MIKAFLAERGLAVDDLELARLLRFDPRRRAVICASTLIDVREAVVALGAIMLDTSAPDIVLVGHDPDGELRALLVAALAGRRQAHAA